MARRALEPASFEDLYREIEKLPEGMTGEILTPGIVQTMGRPSADHRRAAQEIFTPLNRRRMTVGRGWWIENEPEIRFPGPRLFVPDIAGWRIERSSKRPEGSPIELLPDWVCEVLSPSTSRTDRQIKLPVYARSGVSWIWMVDPKDRLVEVYSTVDGKPMLMVSAAEADEVPLPPFDLPIALAVLWDDPPAPEQEAGEPVKD